MNTGDTFGRLTVTALMPGSLATVRCECGQRRAVKRSSLTAGLTRSCGCLAREKSSQRMTAMRTRHGHAAGDGSPEYIAWVNAKQRVTNPKSPQWHNYGGRGISMSPTWAKDFSAFLADIGPKPDPELSLDRIDVDGNYEPGNVRWTTDDVQQANRRPRNAVSA